MSVEAVYEVGAEPADPPQTTETTQKTQTTQTTTTGSGKLGDVNEDKSIDVADAVLLARFVAEDSEANVSSQGKQNADVNRNGNPDSEDVVTILKYIAKLIQSF